MTERLEQILDYYREKSNKIDAERTEWLQQLNYIKQSVQNVHLKEKEVLQKKLGIAEQQRALSETHILLIEEKLQELMIIKDNEELMRTREKDLIKIKELMSLADDFKKDTKPREVEVIDSRPEEDRQESLALEKNEKSRKNTSETYVSKYKQSMKVCKNKKSGKIKTIFLPHEDVNKLRGQIERLKKYKQDQRALYSQCLAAYEKDRDIKKEEMALRKKDFEAKYTQLKELLDKRDEKKEEICKEYFRERHRVKEQVYPAVEALSERLSTTKSLLESKLEEEKTRQEREVAFKVKNLQKNVEDYTNKFRNEVKKKEHKVNVLRDQYMHLQKVYVENLKALEFELEKYLRKEAIAEDKRLKEAATFKEDIAVLKSRVADYEAYLKKIKDLSDKNDEAQLKIELGKSDEKKAEILLARQEIKKMLLFIKTKSN